MQQEQDHHRGRSMPPPHVVQAPPSDFNSRGSVTPRDKNSLADFSGANRSTMNSYGNPMQRPHLNEPPVDPARLH